MAAGNTSSWPFRAETIRAIISPTACRRAIDIAPGKARPCAAEGAILGEYHGLALFFHGGSVPGRPARRFQPAPRPGRRALDLGRRLQRRPDGPRQGAFLP